MATTQQRGSTSATILWKQRAKTEMNTDKTPDKNTVREQLLDHAQALLMTRGYNGFSYRDLSALVGVKTSSIHYYFPSKDDLVLEAVNAYSNEVLGALHGIN